MRAQRHEFEETIQYEFTHTVLKDVNMTGELSAHRILAHRNTSEVVFVEKGGFSLRNFENQNQLMFHVKIPLLCMREIDNAPTNKICRRAPLA